MRRRHHKRTAFRCPLRLLLRTFAVSALAISCARAVHSGDEFFESKIRPILAQHCFECHGANKQESGLRLDSRAFILKGGDSGPAAVPAQIKNSLIVNAVRHAGDLKMPPEKKLLPEQIAAIEKWIEFGLPWPQTHGPQTVKSIDESAENHWAFRPVTHPQPPVIKADGWPKTDIDRFILHQLRKQQLSPAAQASPHVLIRRATLDLLGLPPTPEEVTAFEKQWAEDDALAWSNLLTRLLSSPHYGEHQARAWLDVARYADNKGYVFFEEKNFPWAWTYRDWVVEAFNNDLPYDEFVRLQLAADQLAAEDRQSLAAMGFLTLGPRFMNNTHDIIDDRIDVVTRGLLGLTVTCARCHDHKFDPIPQVDYYSLYGVFRSSREPILRPLFRDPPETDDYRKFAAGLNDRSQKLESFIETQRLGMMAGSRKRAAEYLLAAHNKRHHPSTENFMLLTDKGAIIPAMLHRWEVWLKKARRDNDPVWAAWLQFSDLPDEEFIQRATIVHTKIIGEQDAAKINPLVRQAFEKKRPASMQDVANIYGELLSRIDADWQSLQQQDSPPNRLDDASAEAIRQVLYGHGSPPMVPTDLGWGFLDLLPDRPTQGEFKKLLGEVENFSRTGTAAPPRAMVLVENETPYDPVVFRRGNPNREGDSVPRQFLRALSDDNQSPFKNGSGRLELANAIASKDNPLTARVFVNRIWQQHFGTGLVETASDFGLRSQPPSHPELLDWLATEFVSSGWSVKHLHRLIMTSAVYRQKSRRSKTDQRAAVLIDDANRLLWKFPRRRLGFEATRDVHLAVAAALNTTVGGPPTNVLSGYNTRRTLYGFVNRMDLPGLMRTFDFPEPAATSPGRDTTTVPQQALFFLNHDFVRQTAARILKRSDVTNARSAEERIDRIYQILFARRPDNVERNLGTSFVSRDAQKLPPTAWRYGYGGIDEEKARVASFTELTHWTGKRIQAGPALPDAKLGWVFHDRTGGHPASSSDRCFILRWVSPVSGTVSIAGKLAHRPEEGNGIRARIVSSESGILGEWKADHSEAATSVAAARVVVGSTIDFIVDWQGHITHDEFEWPVVVQAVEVEGSQSDKQQWSSEAEFRQVQADPWTDYVHSLLMTNEFVFLE